MYYRGITHALLRISHDEGVKGLYKGLGATLLGVGPNLAINFCVYETLKSLWLEKSPESSPIAASLACGSIAGIFSSSEENAVGRCWWKSSCI
jgi:solute carrier family 25 phosphate transporter 23/24/25/41